METDAGVINGLERGADVVEEKADDGDGGGGEGRPG